MQVISSNKPSLADQFKLSCYWGLVMGLIVGSGLAVNNAWLENHYVQKGLTFVVLEVFFESLLSSSVTAIGVLILLIPGVAILGKIRSGWRNESLARFAIVVGGMAFLAGGYWLNKSKWFPPAFTPKGMLGNLAVALLCLGLTAAVYKVSLSTRLKLPLSDSNLMARLYHRWTFAALLVSFVGFTGYAGIKVAFNHPARPNVVLITIDTLRADRLGCYGNDRETSPTIDRLAQEGTLFSQAFVSRGLTWPSLTSIMTSLYPKTHGVRKNQVPLDGQYITLAEILKNQGYRTGAFVANYYHAPNRGFDEKKGGEVGNLDKTITRDALEWLGSIDPQDDNFFMWMHYKNPHDPYTPPEPFTNMFDSTYTGPFDGSRPVLDSIYVNQIDLSDRDLSRMWALYDAEIRSSDSYLERVMQRLEEMGVVDNTLIVFSSDHGEEIYEHNYYFFHSCSMYDGVLNVPLIMKFPDVIPAGQVVKNQVESIDIVPTILEFLKIPSRPEFEGHSLLPIVFGEVNGAWRPAFAERASSIFSIRTPEWKYIYNPDNYHTYCSRSEDDDGSGYLIAEEELYHLPSDPKERTNVVDKHPDLAMDLRAQIIEWLNTNKRQHEEYKLTKEAEERLRALGYLK